MKKLIALAVAALPMAAMADVTLYGNIEASIENGKSVAYAGGNTKSTAATKSTTRVDDTGSLIGFKGSENLGNGLKAIWQVEQGLNIDGTTGAGSGNGYNNTWATRDSFIGLTGNFDIAGGNLASTPRFAHAPGRIVTREQEFIQPRAWSEMAFMERSRGVFLSSASPV